MSDTNCYGRGRSAVLRRWAHEAIASHRAEGTLPTSLRHLYYEAVMASLIDKKATGARRPDQDLTDAITWLREAGLVPWDAIEDRTRRLIDFTGWPTVTAAAEQAARFARLDPWDDVLPVLVVESESVAGVLERLAADYRVPIVPTRGQANGWLRTAVAGALAGRAVAGLYVGDYDKAGTDIEAHSRRVLTEVTEVAEWLRLALTAGQVEACGLPLIDRQDKRTHLTYRVCEVEALPQRVLLTDVAAALANHLDEPLDAVQERERAEQAHVLARLTR
jgi:hypothetical protein